MTVVPCRWDDKGGGRGESARHISNFEQDPHGRESQVGIAQEGHTVASMVNLKLNE